MPSSTEELEIRHQTLPWERERRDRLGRETDNYMGEERKEYRRLGSSRVKLNLEFLQAVLRLPKCIKIVYAKSALKREIGVIEMNKMAKKETENRNYDKYMFEVSKRLKQI